MPVPILKQGEFLIATVQSALSDREVLQLQDDLAEHVGSYRSRGVILDVTALDIMDSFVSRAFRSMALMAKLKGAETVIVGIQPEVAFSLVQLGLTLEGGEHRARSGGGAGVPPGPGEEETRWKMRYGYP